MKERIRCLLLTFIIALVFCVNVSATEQTGAQLYYVTDEAGLLSENENMMLEKMAETDPYRDRSFPTGSSRDRHCDMAENGKCIKKSNR